jgi:hypothetical protein
LTSAPSGRDASTLCVQCFRKAGGSRFVHKYHQTHADGVYVACLIQRPCFFFSNDARHGTANDTDAGHASDGALGIAVTMLAGVGPGGSLWTHKGKK